MTNPRDDLMALAPCPFCGGDAERIDIPTVGSDPELGGDPNAGGSCISCKRCAASTALHFDRKENLYSSWNDRLAASRPAMQVVDREAVGRTIKAAYVGATTGRILNPAKIEFAEVYNRDWLACADAILSLLRPAEPVENVQSDIVAQRTWFDGENVRTENLTADDFYQKPDATPDAVVEPVAWDHRVLCACENCTEHAPENSVFAREDIGVMPDGTWLCEYCYSDCEKTAYGMIANDIDNFEYPRFEDLPRPSLYTHPPKSPDTSAAVLAERERCAIEARQYVSAHGHHCFWGGSVIDYGWDKEQDKRMRKFIGDIALGVEKAIRQLPTERGDK